MINPTDRKVIGKVHFEIPGITEEAIQPVGVRITNDGKTAFVALGPANRVAVVDTATLKVREVPARRPARLADGLHARTEAICLTTNGTSNDVSVIDVAALKVTNRSASGAILGASWSRRSKFACDQRRWQVY